METNKTTLKIIGVLLGTYLASAFITAEFNPMKWWMIGRFVYVAIVTVSIGGILTEEANDE